MSAPEPQTRLDKASLKRVPDRPGIYAAWLVDDQPLREAGIAGPPPVLAYVGVATRRTLRTRVAMHLQTSFGDLAELLATRGRALAPWWGRWWKPGELYRGEFSHRPRPSPLAEVSYSQTRTWQERWFVWGWRVCPPEKALSAERKAIRAEGPLLNRSGVSRSLPPQLRRIGGYARPRARWLWQMSWLGVFDELLWEMRDTRWAKLDHPEEFRVMVCVDELGYPKPLGEGMERTLAEAVSPLEILDRASRGAPSAVRDAIAQLDPEDEDWGDESYAWWAAHAAAQLLDPQVNVADALANSLSCKPVACVEPSPRQLPPEPTRSELVRQSSQLAFMRH